MSSSTVEYFYDYVDPASYLVDHLLRDLAPAAGITVSPRPFEIRRPPAPLVDARSPDWREYLEEMREIAGEVGLSLHPPPLVPWSRKAHELALHAREEDRFGVVHAALYRAYFADGRDIGRVDVLVDVAADAGLDRSGAKAVLDVDRHLSHLEEARSRAERLGVRGVPTLLAEGRKLEGFHSRPEIRSFLDGH